MLAYTTTLALCHSTRTLLTPCTRMVQNVNFPYLIAPVDMSIRKLNDQQLKQRIKLLKAPTETGSQSGSPSHVEEGQSLVLLFSWLGAKERHIKKYVTFYNGIGVDVLTVQTPPRDFLFPTTGSQIVVEEVLKCLQSYPDTLRCIVHGFSVGAYAFCEACVMMNKTDSQYKQLVDRFVGQIWDSPVDAQGVTTAVPAAVTKNKLFRKVGQILLETYVENSSATKYHRASAKMFHEPFLKAPALLLTSKTDPIARPDMIKNATKDWKKHNFPMIMKTWDKSPHANHYGHHKKEYEEQILNFLQMVNFIDCRSRAQNKILVDQAFSSKVKSPNLISEDSGFNKYNPRKLRKLEGVTT